MEKSFWYSEKPQYDALKEDIECDVCVIGGGLAGLTAAYEYTLRGHRVSVLEAGRVCGGQSGRSSANISYAHDLIYYRLIKQHGLQTATSYYRQNLKAAQRIKSIIDDEQINCDYRPYDGIIYARTKKGAKQIKKELDAYKKIGIEFEVTTNTGLPFEAMSAVRIDGLATINPFEYVHGLAGAVVKKGGKIYENTHITEQPKDGELKVGDLTVKAKYFVAATHFPYINLPGFYFIKMYQHRSHNVVFETDVKLPYIYSTADEGGFEYRQADDRHILCGGANVRTGRYHYESCYQKVIDNIANDFFSGNNIEAQSAVKSKFAAQDCMTFDLLPIAGDYSLFTENFYVISGFNKWGFTNSIVAAEHVVNETHTGNNIFSPTRVKGVASFFKATANAGSLVKEFAGYILNTDVKKIGRLGKEQGAIIKQKGKRIGVYKDKDGKIHAVEAVCTHMGCPLKWNKDEKSFDCTCHGSRFDANGKILDNPALKDLPRVKLDNENL